MAAPAAEGDASAGVQRGILRAATIILLGNILSRLVGFARDVAHRHDLRHRRHVLRLLTALKVQTSVYDLLISGVISAAFIPVFSELRDRREEFGRVASSVLTVTVVVMAAGHAAHRSVRRAADRAAERRRQRRASRMPRSPPCG